MQHSILSKHVGIKLTLSIKILPNGNPPIFCKNEIKIKSDCFDLYELTDGKLNINNYYFNNEIELNLNSIKSKLIQDGNYQLQVFIYSSKHLISPSYQNLELILDKTIESKINQSENVRFVWDFKF